MELCSPPHTIPSKPNTVPTTNTPEPSNVPPPNIDVDEEWAKTALEDDIVSVDGSNE